VAVLSNPTLAAHATELRELEIAARSMKVALQLVEARAPGELSDAVSRATKERADALLTLVAALFLRHRMQIVELAARNRLPTVANAREFPEAGGLMAYGVSIRDNFRRAAGYVDRILKGAKPGDLPIERPTKFELVINMRTAKTLGLTISPSLLARADQVIE
jgi:putative ABC transport system substrate-binding protein